MEIKEAQIDTDVIAKMHEEALQIELGISDEKQINRTELNFLAELLSTINQLNKSLDELHNTLTMATAKELTGYMEEFSNNYKAEEKKQKVMQFARNKKKTT